MMRDKLYDYFCAANRNTPLNCVEAHECMSLDLCPTVLLGFSLFCGFRKCLVVGTVYFTVCRLFVKEINKWMG
jgi:hypothetical protein